MSRRHHEQHTCSVVPSFLASGATADTRKANTMALNTDTKKSLFPDAVYIPAQQGPAIEGDAPSVRVPLCADMEAAQVAEGATISETEAALSEIEIHTRKLALLTKMSYEAYSHSDATNLLTDTMRRSITNAADKAFLTNAKGSDGTPVGITNTDGAVKPEVGITDSLAPLLEAIGEVGEHGAAPSHVLLGYDAWAKLMQLTDKNGNMLFNPTVSADTASSVFGLPFVRSKFMPKNTLMVIDSTDIVASVSDVRLQVSDMPYFSSDSIGIRVIYRLGWGIAHPDHHALLTIGTAK